MRTSCRFTSRCRVALTAILVSAAGTAAADDAPASVPAQSLPTEWKEWNGHYYRLEADGHLSCYSENISKNACSINAPVEEKGQPLKCNDARWGGKEHQRTGYQVAGHSCNRAYANLFADWLIPDNKERKLVLGATPRGEVMCMSADGTTCLDYWSQEVPNVIDPLVCGRMHKMRHQFTGYEPERAPHWCQTALYEVLYDAQRPDATLVPMERDTYKMAWERAAGGHKKWRPVKNGTVPDHQWVLDVDTPGWRAGDHVDWILEFRGMLHHGTLVAVPEVRFEALADDWTAGLSQYATPGELPTFDDGPLFLGIRMDGGPRVRYFATTGESDSLFAPEHEITNFDASSSGSRILHRASTGGADKGKLSVTYRAAKAGATLPQLIERVTMIRHLAPLNAAP